MIERRLGALQVAALLVSASYGIGMLFGTGEQALQYGMAGGLYAVGTSVGMVLLAFLSRRIWTLGMPIWALFAQAYGDQLRRPVAGLSLVWMAGVLAAQIHGGTAVLQLLGLGEVPALVVVLALLAVVSSLDLRWAASVFAGCLFASVVVLVYAVIVSGGWSLYLNALSRFAHDAGELAPGHLWGTVMAVSFLVCMGADYQQFVLAARNPFTGLWGCVVAAVALLTIGFLPPTLVVAAINAAGQPELRSSSQVVPWAIGRVVQDMGSAAEVVMLLSLLVAAFGAGAAVLRAMVDALAATVPLNHSGRRRVLNGLALVLGASLALRGQGIIDTMVSANVVYIASIGVAFVALILGIAMPPSHAKASMLAGFVSALLMQWIAVASPWGSMADLLSLASGLAFSLATVFWCIVRRRLFQRESGIRPAA